MTQKKARHTTSSFLWYPGPPLLISAADTGLLRLARRARAGAARLNPTGSSSDARPLNSSVKPAATRCTDTGATRLYRQKSYKSEKPSLSTRFPSGERQRTASIFAMDFSSWSPLLCHVVFRSMVPLMNSRTRRRRRPPGFLGMALVLQYVCLLCRGPSPSRAARRARDAALFFLRRWRARRWRTSASSADDGARSMRRAAALQGKLHAAACSTRMAARAQAVAKVVYVLVS